MTGLARFSGGTVDFSDAVFSGGTVNFRPAVFSSGTVDFSDAAFSGGTMDFSSATGPVPTGLLAALGTPATGRVILSSAWVPPAS
ncbi:pentapeptide repeat-containing protein (plasmid) [Streptomyces anulatus]|nr:MULTISPECIES: pentapeptide repeat-containing protein [unclassified Streptomyces]